VSAPIPPNAYTLPSERDREKETEISLNFVSKPPTSHLLNKLITNKSGNDRAVENILC